MNLKIFSKSCRGLSITWLVHPPCVAPADRLLHTCSSPVCWLILSCLSAQRSANCVSLSRLLHPPSHHITSPSHHHHITSQSAQQLLVTHTTLTHTTVPMEQVPSTLVMWSETVGLRTRLVWDQKKRSWSCILWSWSCTSGVVLWNMVFLRSSS